MFIMAETLAKYAIVSPAEYLYVASLKICPLEHGRCNIVLHELEGLPMTLTVRLDPQLEAQLERHCRKQRQTKTQVLTALLREHLAATAGAVRSPGAIARELRLVGAFASGKGDLAEKRKRHLADKLRAKHPR